MCTGRELNVRNHFVRYQVFFTRNTELDRLCATGQQDVAGFKALAVDFERWAPRERGLAVERVDALVLVLALLQLGDRVSKGAFEGH
jgi:hypothetical protein